MIGIQELPPVPFDSDGFCNHREKPQLRFTPKFWSDFPSASDRVAAVGRVRSRLAVVCSQYMEVGQDDPSDKIALRLEIELACYPTAWSVADNSTSGSRSPMTAITLSGSWRKAFLIAATINCVESSTPLHFC